MKTRGTRLFPRTCRVGTPALVTSLLAATALFFAHAREAAAGSPQAEWDEFAARHPGTWFTGSSLEGRVPWIVGDGYRVGVGAYPVDLARELGTSAAPPTSDRTYPASVAPKGMSATDRMPPGADLSAIPRFTESADVAIALTYSDADSGVDSRSVRIKRNGEDVTARFAVGSAGASSRSALELREGRNAITVTLRDLAGNLAAQTAIVERLTAEEAAAIGVSRGFLEEVAPVLEIDPGQAGLLLGRIDHWSVPVKGGSEVAPAITITYVPQVEGTPVHGTKVSTILYKEPRSGRYEAAAAVNGARRLPPSGASIGRILSPDQARQAMAEHVGEGDARTVSLPTLRWVSPDRASFRPAYLAYRYGLGSADLDRGTSVEHAFTVARVVLDAATGDLLAVDSLVREAGVYVDKQRPIIDGPPENLDVSLKSKILPDLHEVAVESPYGTDIFTSYCADGPNVKVLNNAQAGILNLFLIVLAWFVPDGDLVCFNPAAEGVTGQFPFPDLVAAANAGPADNSAMDDALDGWTAYYHTDWLARFLDEEIDFQHDFPAAGDMPAQMMVAANPLVLADNAFAIPKMVATLDSLEELERSGIVFGTGTGYAQTQLQGAAKFMRADWTRDRGIIYHEYGHTVLFGKGFFGESTFESALHEGYADYVARVAQGGFPTGTSAFILQGNGAALTKQRHCGGDLPVHAKFVTLDADDPEGSAVDAHTSGQAFCQALARAESRTVAYFGADATDTLLLGTHTANLWNVDEEGAGSVVQGILVGEAIRMMIDHMFGGNSKHRDDEIRTALALHGLVESEDGREAALSLSLAEGATYTASSNKTYVAATGINTNFTLEFSKNANAANVCHSEHQVAGLVKPDSTTRWRFGSFSFPNLVKDCVIPAGSGPADLYVRVASCTGAANCRTPQAQNVKEMAGPPIPIKIAP